MRPTLNCVCVVPPGTMHEKRLERQRTLQVCCLGCHGLPCAPSGRARTVAPHPLALPMPGRPTCTPVPSPPVLPPPYQHPSPALPPLRTTIISGGGSLTPALDDWYEVIDLTVLNGWGLTETSPVLACRRRGNVSSAEDALLMSCAAPGRVWVGRATTL